MVGSSDLSILCIDDILDALRVPYSEIQPTGYSYMELLGRRARPLGQVSCLSNKVFIKVFIAHNLLGTPGITSSRTSFPFLRNPIDKFLAPLSGKKEIAAKHSLRFERDELINDQYCST